MTRIQSTLLLCGVISGALQIGTDIIAASFLYPGYDYSAQQVSELSAIGAPSRPFWLLMSSVMAALTAAFGIGVWLTPGPEPALRITAAAIVGFAINGLLWVSLAPMHMRATTFTSTDIAHIAFTVSAVLLMTCFIGFGANVLGRAFRLYSIATVVAMLVAGSIVGTQITAIASGAPTPWMGLIERISVYGPMVWMAAFSILLQRRAAVSSGRTAPAI